MSHITSSLTSSAVTALVASTSQSAKSALLSSKSRINNLSFPKFKPNAREFILQSIKNTSAQITTGHSSSKHQPHHNNSGIGGGGSGSSVNNGSSSGVGSSSSSSGHLYNPKLETSMLEAHKDGIWDISCINIPAHLFTSPTASINHLNYKNVNLLVGTASADSTARLWYFNQHQPISGGGGGGAHHNHHHHHQPNRTTASFCVQEYCGHAGSVNSIRFHPRFFSHATNLILTASGDGQAHIWQSVLSPLNDSLESKSDLVLNYNNCFSIAFNQHTGKKNLINGLS